MDTSLPPEARAEMVLKQMTLDEKLALLHGNGMAHASQWQMPLTQWKRITLAPGQSQTVTVAIDPRVLQTFDESSSGWKLAPGDYEVFVGPSSDNTALKGHLQFR
jgi:hypothetical protein